MRSFSTDNLWLVCSFHRLLVFLEKIDSGNLLFLNNLGFAASFWEDQNEIISSVPFLVKGEFMILLPGVLFSKPNRTSNGHFPLLAQSIDTRTCMSLFFIVLIEYFSLQN